MTEKIYNSSISLAILTSALLLFQEVAATTVYQWTDEEGVVHFSDVAPPEDTSASIEKIEFTEYADNSTDPEKYSITSQLERMTEWRRQLSEERLARKQLQLEAMRIAREQEAERFVNSYNSQPYYTPAYYSPSYFYQHPGYFNGYQPWHRRPHVGHHNHNKGGFINRPSQSTGFAFKAIFK